MPALIIRLPIWVDVGLVLVVVDKRVDVEVVRVNAGGAELGPVPVAQYPELEAETVAPGQMPWERLGELAHGYRREAVAARELRCAATFSLRDGRPHFELLQAADEAYRYGLATGELSVIKHRKAYPLTMAAALDALGEPPGTLAPWPSPRPGQELPDENPEGFLRGGQ